MRSVNQGQQESAVRTPRRESPPMQSGVVRVTNRTPVIRTPCTRTPHITICNTRRALLRSVFYCKCTSRTLRAASLLELFHSLHCFHRGFVLASHDFAMASHGFTVTSQVGRELHAHQGQDARGSDKAQTANHRRQLHASDSFFL